MKSIRLLNIAVIVMSMFFCNSALAFNDWAEVAESDVPGATDYDNYLTYLWQVVDHELSKQQEEAEKVKIFQPKDTRRTIDSQESVRP